MMTKSPRISVFDPCPSVAAFEAQTKEKHVI
jgi:hypothetical protein